MKTTRNTDVDTVLAPAHWGTGTVYMEPVAAPSPSGLGAAVMRFAPGARTVWHTRPRGQTILVTDGVGRCQRRAGPLETVSAATPSPSARTKSTGTARHQTATSPS